MNIVLRFKAEGKGPGRGWWGPDKGGTHVAKKPQERVTEGELRSDRSGPFRGYVWRAVDPPTEGSSRAQTRAALGTGTYFTPSEDIAKGYGQDVRRFYVNLDKVLGTNSQEHIQISNAAKRKWTGAQSLAQEIRVLAEERGYDAIYSGPTFGLVVFDKGKIEEGR